MFYYFHQLTTKIEECFLCGTIKYDFFTPVSRSPAMPLKSMLPLSVHLHLSCLWLSIETGNSLPARTNTNEMRKSLGKNLSIIAGWVWADWDSILLWEALAGHVVRASGGGDEDALSETTLWNSFILPPAMEHALFDVCAWCGQRAGGTYQRKT